MNDRHAVLLGALLCALLAGALLPPARAGSGDQMSEATMTGSRITESAVHSEKLRDSLLGYLAKVIEGAPALALRSPHAAEDIRALASDLIRRIREAEKKGEDIAALQTVLRERLAELFPKEAVALQTFQARADAILAEFPDALRILLRGRENVRRDFEERVSGLRSSLPLLVSSGDVALWRGRLGRLAQDLLPFAPAVPVPQLRKDFEALLENLASSLREAEQVPLPLSEPLDAVTALSESVRRMENEEDLKAVMRRLEEILHALRAMEPYPVSSTES